MFARVMMDDSVKMILMSVKLKIYVTMVTAQTHWVVTHVIVRLDGGDLIVQ